MSFHTDLNQHVSKAYRYPFPKEKNKPHSWTQEQKYLLCVLEKFFYSADSVEQRLSREDRHKVFCTCFAETFMPIGLPSQISAGAVDSYFQTLRRNKDENYVEVFGRSSISEKVSERWPDVRKQIVRATCASEVHLLEKNQAQVDQNFLSTPLPTTPKKRARRQSSEVSEANSSETDNSKWNSQWNEERQETTSKTLLYTPRKKQQLQLATPESTPQKGVKIFSCESQSQERKLLPLNTVYEHHDHEGKRVRSYEYDDSCKYETKCANMVAFRCWDQFNQGENNSDRFWAADYQGRSPPSRNDAAFGESAFRHLHRIKEKTPWISLWASLLPALDRLLRSPSAKITIVNLAQLASEQSIKYSRVYPASSVIWQWNLQEIPYNSSQYMYTGGSEWIVWERVKPETVIGTVSYDQIKEHLEQNPELKIIFETEKLKQTEWVKDFGSRKIQRDRAERNPLTGAVVGKFLAFLGVPDWAVHKIAAKIASTWGFTGSNYEGYVNGVNQGFRSFISNAPDRRQNTDDLSNEDENSLLSGNSHTEPDNKLGTDGDSSEYVDEKYQFRPLDTKLEKGLRSWDQEPQDQGDNYGIEDKKKRITAWLKTIETAAPLDLCEESEAESDLSIRAICDSPADHRSKEPALSLSEICGDMNSDDDSLIMVNAQSNNENGPEEDSPFLTGVMEAGKTDDTGEEDSLVIVNAQNSDGNGHGIHSRLLAGVMAAANSDGAEDSTGSFQWLGNENDKDESAQGQVEDLLERRQSIEHCLRSLIEYIPEPWQTTILDEGAMI